MNTRLRITLLAALAVIASVSVARPASAHDRVQQVCVIAGDLGGCLPQDA